MAGDIKNPDNKKFDKINSLKKRKKEKNIRDDIRKDTAQELPRGLQIDTTTSSYGDSGQGRKVPQFKDGGRVAKGCGAILSNRRKKTKYF
jgi:hypothetical protein